MNDIIKTEQTMLVKTEEISPLVRLAMSGKLDLEQLDKLIDVQDKYEKIQAEKSFYKAFALFKQNNVIITKNKLVSFQTGKGKTEYKHATLDHIMSIISPLLAEQGLGISWKNNTNDKGQITVTVILAHVSGFTDSSTQVAPPDSSGGKNSIQAVGSTITYLQRYMTLSILGLAAGDDDDGQASEGKVIDYITSEQLFNIETLIDDHERENVEFTRVICEFCRVPSLQHIQAKNYATIVKKISKT